jgi:hypothetical protein
VKTKTTVCGHTNNKGYPPATSLPFNYIVFSLQQWAGYDAEKILFLYTLLLVKTPTRAVDINLLVYTLVGENTNKGGGQKIVGLYSCW